ncbi:MAG: hypothetical protein K2N34_14585, partial [Lachnospiraceae bacterium]|nr:hypothetical protein [Lachnospiraceae bacterium]
IIDYLKALEFPFLCKKFCGGTKMFHQIDVTYIVNADIVSSIGSANSLYGILNYFFIKRIKETGIIVESLIGWYEGQPSSLGLFAAFHKNYSGKRSMGYEGLPIDMRTIQYAPSHMQWKYGIAPKQIGVIAEIFKKTAQQFESEMDTISIPPFRMQGAFGRDTEAGQIRTNKILVALPYGRRAGNYIINELNRIKDFFKRKQISLLLKNHPVQQDWTLKEYGCNELEINYEFITGDFDNAVDKADIVLTCASTTSYETALLGKPIIILALPSEIVLTYMPSEWEGKRFMVAYNSEDIMEYIKLFSNHICEPLKLTSNKYLTKASRETVKELLGSL